MALGVWFVAAVGRAADADESLWHERPRVEWVSGQFAPAEVAHDSALVSADVESHGAVTGAEARLDAATYGADMQHFLIFEETPCVM